MIHESIGHTEKSLYSQNTIMPQTMRNNWSKFLATSSAKTTLELWLDIVGDGLAGCGQGMHEWGEQLAEVYLVGLKVAGFCKIEIKVDCFSAI